jgi:hypothetical protein
MKSLIVDKIASVAIHNHLSHDVRIDSNIKCTEGSLVAVKILNNKSRYNDLELISGRMAKVNKGDIVIGALGERKALFGYSGYLPNTLKVGQHINLLNLGGVMGICDSANPNLGDPFDCEVLGGILEFPYLGERIGIPAKAGDTNISLSLKKINAKVPVVAIVGTCMDSGKTVASCAIISHFKHLGLNVNAFKATGVALRRDVLAMEDAGAQKTMVFSDYGVMSSNSDNAPMLTSSMIHEMSQGKPDVVVFELGDGLLGSYGVESILKNKNITSTVTSWVLCANDPVGAWGGYKFLTSEFNITPTIITGSATDNAVGIDIIKNRMNIDAINAMTDGPALGSFVAKSLKFEVGP